MSRNNGTYLYSALANVYCLSSWYSPIMIISEVFASRSTSVSRSWNSQYGAIPSRPGNTPLQWYAYPFPEPDDIHYFYDMF